MVVLVADGNTHTTLNTFFMALGLDQFVPEGAPNKEAKVQAVISRLRDSRSAEDADLMFRQMAETFLGRWGNQVLPDHLEPFLQQLRADGWLWDAGRLIPATPGPADLAPEVEGLERDLAEVGLDVAARHYAQAIASFRSNHFEASNGQLRSFLENLVIELCARVKEQTFADPSAAAQHLMQHRVIDAGEYNVVRGLLDVSNRRGAHHGLSDAREALFRLHFSTALARYVLGRTGLIKECDAQTALMCAATA